MSGTNRTLLLVEAREQHGGRIDIRGSAMLRGSYVGVIDLHKSRILVAECRKINGALFEGKSPISDTRRLGDANKSRNV